MLTLEEFILKDADLRELERNAEESLCGSILRGGDEKFEQVRDVMSVEDFRVETCRWLWEAFERLHDAQIKIDQFTVADELTRMGRFNDFSDGVWSGYAYLSRIVENSLSRNATAYAENVKNYANKRRLAEFSKRIYEWATNGRRDKDIVADTMAELGKLIVFGAQDDYTVTLKESLSLAYDWATRAAAGEVVGIPTGLIDLDAILNGMIAGNMYVIAARPGVGKTAFLITVALHAARILKKRVAIFSLEMTHVQVTQRMIAQIAQIDLEKVISGKMSPDEWNRFNGAIEVLEDLNISINDMPAIKPSQIRQTARRIKAKGGLDLVLVDYIQLAESDSTKKNETREREVSQISRGLIALARELQVPLLAAAQLNRAVEQRSDKRPVLSDLRESGSLEQDSYCVMFLHKPKPDTEPNVVELDVAKHRNGKVGSIELIFSGEYTQFRSAVKRIFRPNEEQES